MRILLLTPPMTQLNTPYPATAYLKGFLRKERPDLDVRQADPAIELVLRLFSKKGVRRVCADLDRYKFKDVLQAQDAIERAMEPAIRFLQGKDPSLAIRIASREFLPEGPRFATIKEQGGDGTSAEDPLFWAFGQLGVQDRAKYLASLFVDDWADVIRQGIDPRFELSKYAEKLAASTESFDPLGEALENSETTLVDRILDEMTTELVAQHRPDIVGISVPFPGNVYGGLRIARRIKKLTPLTRVILGGGYANTELRELSDPRVFDYVDFITLDDGERPFLSLLELFEGKRNSDQLLRTFVCEGGKVAFKNDASLTDFAFREVGTPTYEGLKLDQYLSIVEMLNPMHRIWSDGRWNKVTLAHGCYWKKCNFCDVNLDYIGRYDPAAAEQIVDRIEALVQETGQSGFHLVDEAAPPTLLKAMAERLLARGVVITWWGNIRFEKAFTPALAELLARSGCVAVSGGLEVASDRLLKLMNKGVSVEQVARVTNSFTQAGIMVHAYLMYGFPTQTEGETMDALDRVRQLFAAGCIQSAYWHRFSATVHSPIGRAPEKFGIRILKRPPPVAGVFARNDLVFKDPVGADHDRLGVGLKKAIYNYMHGAGLDEDVRCWFEEVQVGKKGRARFQMPAAQVPPDLIQRALE
ncbi:radical SAM protein [Bdellovibrionota bacterium FG-1]